MLLPVHYKHPKYTNKKAIISGDVIEVTCYEKGVYYNYECDNKGKVKSSSDKIDYNISRSKKMLRRIINSNVTGNDTFITLTYANNFIDVTQAKVHFKRFIQQMKRHGYTLKYVYVIEFQKRGAIHFHCIFFDVPFIPLDILQKCWKHGFINLHQIDNVDNVGAYVVKYMEKDLVNSKLNGHDLYGRSRGLKKPLEIKNPKEVQKLLEAYSKNLTYTNSFYNDYQGTCIYMQFNKKRFLK